MSVLAALTRLDSATDGQLLGRFVQSRDADAFTTLVRRLGPTVLAVCRRVCPDAHLAEDAFQAAFLVLARKAESVKPREKVAVWLHGVAYRTASKARSLLASRRRETAFPVLPETPAPEVAVTDDDTLRELDAAIAGLPEHLRAAVVLCELDGRSRKDAAKQLGIPEGTLSSRLADARKRLGDRLRPTAAAAVSLTLAARTAEAAVSGVASETVLTLARGAMTMMLIRKLRIPAVAVLVAAAVLTGGSLALFPSPPPATAAPVPKPMKPPAGGIGVTKGGVFYLLGENGKANHEFDVEEGWKLEWLEGPCHVCPSPKGGFPVAVLVPRKGKADGDPPQYELRLIRSADDHDGQAIDTGTEPLAGHLVWSRSGGRFYVSFRTKDGDGKYLVIDAATGKATPFVIPSDHRLLGEAPDGTLVTDGTAAKLAANPVKKFLPERYPHRVSADGKTVTELTPCPDDDGDRTLDLAPDGHTVLSWRFDKAGGTDTLFTFDIATGKTAAVVPKELDGVKLHVHQVKWSPDGKRVGVIYSLRDGPRGFDPDRTLWVCDLDGANGKDVFVWKGRGGSLGEVWDAHFEWN